MSKIILDLCGGTGSWSKPYVDAGYDVRVVTLPDHDVRTYEPPKKVWGILAAPPCPMFSHTRTVAKEPRDIKGALEIVNACLRIIQQVQYDTPTGRKKTPLTWWALENPLHGILPQLIGRPAFTFDPWEFGDGYKKRTALWGNFTDPKKGDYKKPNVPKFDRLLTKEIHGDHYGKLTRTERRAITPAGFAKAFFEANP